MAKALMVLGGIVPTFNASTSYYLYPGNAIISAQTVEANRQVTYRLSGVLSGLWLTVSTNSVTATSTFRTRINGANGSQAVSIGSSATGDFQDASNTDTVVAGDVVNEQLVVGGSGTSLNVPVAAFLFEASSNTAIKWIAQPSATAASTTGYSLPSGSGNPTTTENNHKVQINSAGTWKNLFYYSSSNLRTTTTTIGTRINGANGNMAVSIPATTSGAFEDTSNTDSIATNDSINLFVTTGAGTETLTTNILATDFVTTSNSFTNTSGTNAGDAMDSSFDTDYRIIGGNFRDGSIESNTACDTLITCTASNLWFWLSTNTMNATSTIRLRKNAANGNQALSISAAATGAFEDTSNTDSLVATDEINYSLTEASSSGSFAYYGTSMLFTVPTTGYLPRLSLLGVG